MKREGTNKKKGLVWLIVAIAAVLVAAGVLAAIFLLPGQQGGLAAAGGKAELYWNVDRNLYIGEDGFSTRTKGEDGLYHIRFAIDGEQVEYTVADKRLVNYVDTMDVMGLVKNADGVIVEVVPAAQIATMIADGYFVKKVEGDTLQLNSSPAMNGMDAVIKLTEKSAVYDVSKTAEVVGQKGTCGTFDKVIVFGTADNEVTHVFIVERPVEAGIYWRVERMYDTENACTTRVPDENGVYTIQMAHEGKLVDVKCKNKAIVNDIDAKALLIGEHALVFDEDGYVIDRVDVALALKGKKFCVDYYVTAVEGNVVTAEKLTSGTEQGKVVQFTMNEDCDIFMYCEGCYDHNIGERTDHLQYGDRFTLYTDIDNNPLLALVSRRMTEGEVYFNVTPQYDWDLHETKREPDSKGYYVFDMIKDGKRVTVKTKDRDIASKIDRTGDSLVGLVVKNGVIQRLHLARCILGTYSLGTGNYVTAVSSGIVSVASLDDFSNVKTAFLTSDCKIYDMTGFPGVEMGSETKLQPFDKVTVYRNIYEQANYIVVIDRFVDDAKIYYNVGRRYDEVKQESTRQKDADGYYVFTMICEGKAVTVKTKDKAKADFIDSQGMPIVGLTVKSDVITNVYQATSTVKFGYKTANWNYVEKIEKDGTFYTYYFSNGERKTSSIVQKMAKDCVVYNVSTAFTKNRGEKTTLKVDDQIQAIATNETGEVVQIFVLNRKTDSPLYWNTERMYDGTKQETTRQTDADGYYVFDLMVDGKIKQFKTKDKEVATSVDYYSAAFTMMLEGDTIIRGCAATLNKDVTASAAGYFDTMKLSGNKATFRRNLPSATNFGEEVELTFAKDCKFYDVSPYAANRGAAAKLSLGDRVQCYTNGSGEVSYCFIVYKNTREAGYISHCDHCGEEVFWNPYAGNMGTVDCHYYLTHDFLAPWSGTAGSKEDASTDIVLDLNGYTLTTPGRAFVVYGKLSIIDTVGGGKVAARNENANALGGCALVTQNGTLNLYGGTLTLAEDAKASEDGGVIYLGGTGTTFNMYGGAVTGGEATRNGGNIITYGGTVNIAGGTISGGTAGNSGNNIYLGQSSKLSISGGKITGDVVVGKNATVTLSGKPVITKGQVTGLKLAAGIKANVTGLKSGASIAIEADGIFTDKLNNITTYASYFTPADASGEITTEGNVLHYVKPGAIVLDTEDKGYCEHCDATVQWTALSSALGTLEDGEHHHYYLLMDMAIAKWDFGTLKNGTDVCLHLNSKTLTYGRRLTVAADSTLNIMGGGTMNSDGKDANMTYVTGTVTVLGGTLNIYGGTYACTAENGAPAIKVEYASSVVNLMSGTVVDGINVAGGTLNLSGDATVLGENGEKTDNIFIGVDGKLHVAANYTGNASVLFDFLNGGQISVINGSSEGAYTGKLYYEAEGNPEVIGQDDKLVIQGTVTPDENDPRYADCEHCGQKVMWLEIGNKNLGTISTGEHYHYRLTENVTTDYGFLALGESSKVCLDLNGCTITQAGRTNIGSGTLSIMNSSTNAAGISGSNETNGNINVGWGTLYIYGGTYTSTAANGAPSIKLLQSGSKVYLNGGSVVGGIEITKGNLTLDNDATVLGANGEKSDNIHVATTGKLTVNGTWTGSASASFDALANNVIPTANGVSTGAYTGTLYLEAENNPALLGANGGLVIEGTQGGGENEDENPGGLELDGDNKAVCPHCGGEPVVWTAVTGGLGTINDGAKHHYYLTGSMNIPGGFLNINGGSDVCLHLNNKSLTQNGWINVISGKLHIMDGTAGTGGIVGNHATSNTLNVSWGTLDIYGGTYSYTGAADLATITMIKSSSKVNLLGGTVNGGINVSEGSDLSLDGTATVLGANGEKTGNIHVTETSTLKVNSTWTGSASVSFEVMDNNTISATNGVSTGAYTGKLYLEGEKSPAILGENGGLVIEVDDGSLKLDGDNKAVCPHCGGEPVVWTAATSGLGTINDGAKHHYYLTGSMNIPGDFLIINGSSEVCLHLNNKALTYNGWTNVISGKLHVMDGTAGTGGIVGNHASRNTINVSWGTLDVYGGNISYAGTAELKAVTMTQSSSKVNLLGGNIASIDVANGTATLSGAPVVGKLTLAEGKKINVSGMTGGSVVIDAPLGVFTETISTDAEAIGSYFTVANPNTQKLKVNPADLEIVEQTGLVLDPDNKAVCPHCGGEPVVWTAATGGLGTINDGAKHHYYLTGSMNIPGDFLIINGSSEVCLHLNNKVLTYTGWTNVISGKLHVMDGTAGTGGIVGNHASRNTLNVSWGTLDVYGGNISYAGTAELKAVTMTQSSSKVNLLGGTVNGGINVTEGSDLSLDGAATVLGANGEKTGNIRVTETSTLKVNSTWTGSASVSFDVLTDNTISATNGVSTGAYTGRLFSENVAENMVCGANGGLVLKTAAQIEGERIATAAAAMTFPTDGSNYEAPCPACGGEENVTWKAVTGALSTVSDNTQHHHYYLKSGFDFNFAFLSVGENAEICLHLNGKTVTNRGRLRVISGTLNIMDGAAGTGGITGTHATYSTLYVEYGTLNIYGGTYRYTGTADVPVLTVAQSSGKCNVYAGTIDDDE